LSRRLRVPLAFVCLVAFLNCGGDIETETESEEVYVTTTLAPRVVDPLRMFGRWVSYVAYVDAAERRTEAAAKAETRAGSGAVAFRPPAAATSYPTHVIPPQLVPFFTCVIGHESAGAGVYLAVNPSGRYRGAYQADVNFWRSYAPAEYVHLAGRHELAPPEAQDAAALAGYYAWRSGSRGNPWSGPSGPICEEYAHNDT